MQTKTKAIVLSAIKYQEKSLIVKCFTLSDGLKSYFIPSAFSSRKSNQKIAYFQPLTILEIESNHKNKGTLEYFKEVKLSYNYQYIYTDLIKSSIVFFLSEVLHNCIQEEEKNENLFTFLETSLIWLDTNNTNPNFHLIFLTQLTKYLGFFPQFQNNETNYFDMNEGIFSIHQSSNCLNEFESSLFLKLLKLEFDNKENNFNKEERQLLIKTLLDYYSVHLQGFKKPKSLDILKEIFI